MKQIGCKILALFRLPKRRRIFFLYSVFSCALLSVFSCLDDSGNLIAQDTSEVITFEGFTKDTNTQNDGIKSQWDLGDEIGVFMLESNTQILVDKALNIPYKSNSQGIFTASGKALYYPNKGKSVDFIAYYPYTNNLIGNIYKVKLEDQNKNIDLLYSNNAKAKTINKTPVDMRFTHRLSKLTMNIEVGEGLNQNDLKGLKVSFKGVPSTADFDLLSDKIYNLSGYLEFSPKTLKLDKSYSAILIPQDKNLESKVAFDLVGKGRFVWDLANLIFEKGSHYIYTIKINKKGISFSLDSISKWEGKDNQVDSGEIKMPLIQTVKINAGDFLMGSSDGSGLGLNTAQIEKGREVDEYLHRVSITKDFFMSKYLITNAEYVYFLNAVGVGADGRYADSNFPTQLLIEVTNEPFHWGLRYEAGAWATSSYYKDYPIIKVTWYGAAEFARWLGANLPTEAQWEYASRAGTSTSYAFGNIETELVKYGWFSLNSFKKTYAVGMREPNQWGLYDMYGNVQEWCNDWYRDNYYTQSPEEDPTGPESGAYKVLRGGSWNSFSLKCRSASRNKQAPTIKTLDIGFRIVFQKK